MTLEDGIRDDPGEPVRPLVSEEGISVKEPGPPYCLLDFFVFGFFFSGAGSYQIKMISPALRLCTLIAYIRPKREFEVNLSTVTFLVRQGEPFYMKVKHPSSNRQLTIAYHRFHPWSALPSSQRHIHQ
jgi:hypothetical protein